MKQREERKKIIVSLINDKHYKPLKQKELAFLLQVPAEEKEEFRTILAELVEEGNVILTKRGKYKPVTEVVHTGVFTGHPKGFGFVAVEGEEDYYVSEYSTKGAMHGDVVLIRQIPSRAGRSREAEVIRIVERGSSQIVGYYQKSKNYGFVIPDNRRIAQDIFVPKENSMGAVNGHKVVVEITKYDNGSSPEGKITEIIGHVNDPGTDILSVVRAFDLPMEFGDEIMSYLESVPDRVGEQDIENRMDLRAWKTVTIDGEDAKDLDDAITLTKGEQGYQLGVHIADVTHYVREHSVLDKEAVKRGTSVYLVDRVIPMLPHKLSNGICSLNEGVDRLALSCIMDIDEQGKVTGHQIAETVIRVDRRMSYNQVDVILKAHAASKEMEYGGKTYHADDLDKLSLMGNDGRKLTGRAILEAYEQDLSYFTDMYELSQVLRKQRMDRGSIDFDFPEAKIVLEKDGAPKEIGVYDRNPAHNIIEDFMLMANETIAEDYFWQDIPFEFRTHAAPDGEKVQKLQDMIANFGYYMKHSGEEVHPKEFQKLLKKVQGTPEEGFISRLVLRSMQQARYSTQCTGHFGLATRYYCHFTSPIRRYPDLQIHRIIKENLHGNLTGKRLSHYEGILPQVAEHNSKAERRAQEAEREVEKLKKVQYMKKHIGKIFTGIVSGVTGYGLYVELSNTIEGMVRLASIPYDFFIYNEKDMELVGTDTGAKYRMGQTVKVEVAGVDLQMRTIDFYLVGEDSHFYKW